MLLNIHLNTNSKVAEKFDTLQSPSGAVATLNKIAENFEIAHIGYDDSFPGISETGDEIRKHIETLLSDGQTPIINFSTLVYNAERTMQYTSDLKREFNDKIVTVVGGQLIPHASDAYIKNKDIDIVAQGDGELLIPKIVADIKNKVFKPKYNLWLKDDKSLQGQYAFVSYDNFFRIRERIEKQKITPPYKSQLVIQGLGGPGCSWAANNKLGACHFCALQNITSINKRKISELLENERELQDKFDVYRLFDVSNQFLPTINREEAVAWLHQYIKERKRAGVTLKKYAYLTVSSVDEEIAQLLKEAGIIEAYVGIDHFDPSALKEENKPYRKQYALEKCLNSLKNAGINFRAGVVIGDARETDSSLEFIRQGIKWLGVNYSDNMIALGIFPHYILPGSKAFLAYKSTHPSDNVIKSFESKGYFTDDEQLQLTKSYMDWKSELGSEALLNACVEFQTLANQYTLSYDYNNSPNLLVK